MLIALTNPNDNLLRYELAQYFFNLSKSFINFDTVVFAYFRHIQKHATAFEHKYVCKYLSKIQK